MPSINIPLVKNNWTQITNGESSGNVYHRNGLSLISYIQASSAPVGFSSSSPVAEQSSFRDNISYNNVAPSEYIYAYTPESGVSVTVTAGA